MSSNLIARSNISVTKPEVEADFVAHPASRFPAVPHDPIEPGRKTVAQLDGRLASPDAERRRAGRGARIRLAGVRGSSRPTEFPIGDAHRRPRRPRGVSARLDRGFNRRGWRRNWIPIATDQIRQGRRPLLAWVLGHMDQMLQQRCGLVAKPWRSYDDGPPKVPATVRRPGPRSPRVSGDERRAAGTLRFGGAMDACRPANPVINLKSAARERLANAAAQ